MLIQDHYTFVLSEAFSAKGPVKSSKSPMNMEIVAAATDGGRIRA
jgi:hypothetical protein